MSLQKIDDNDIIEMQRMIKEQLKKWLDEKFEEIDLVDYFGPVHDTDPGKFIFSPGDIRMIKQISKHVQITVQKRGYVHFTEKKCLKKTSDCDDINEHVSETTEMQLKLFNGMLDLLKPYGENVVSLFTKDMAVVVTTGKVIRGRVRCVLCDNDIKPGNAKKKRRCELFSQYWNGHSWCLSNFANHHLRNVHPIEKNVKLFVEENKGSEGSLEKNNGQSTSFANSGERNFNDGSSDDKGVLHSSNYLIKRL